MLKPQPLLPPTAGALGNGSSERLGDDRKRFLVANFLRECGLFWARAVDDPEFLEAWFEKIRPYRARAIEKAMREYLNEEDRFPVPGTLIPRIRQEPNALEGNNTCG